MSRRPATPPIIDDPTNNDSEHNLDWYHGEHAGGHILSFGKHMGQKIHETSITYLYWCNRTLDKNRYGPTIRSFQAYNAGLRRYVATNYGEFRFPFGQYRGMKISECPDSYLSWATSQPHLKTKYGIFFEAVTRWLERPLQENGASSEPSHKKYHRKDGDRNFIKPRGLDEQNKGPVEFLSRSSLQSSVLYLGHKIITEDVEDNESPGVGPQADIDGGKSTPTLDPKSEAEPTPMKQRAVSVTVKLQEGHYESLDYASTQVVKLQVATYDESRPSMPQQNERNLKESEKAEARERQGKNAVATGNALGKWFWKPSAKVT